MGLDQRPGVHVIGMQICPNGRGVIYITLKRELKIGKYCKYEVIDVTISGGRALLVKPAGKREAVVTLKGIQPNRFLLVERLSTNISQGSLTTAVKS